MTDTISKASRPRNSPARCATCESSFMGYSSKARYCSPECKKTYRAAYLKTYHEERPGYQKELTQAYYAANSARMRASRTDWYQANRDKALEAGREYVAKNYDKVQARKREWAKGNPDKVAASRAMAKSRLTAAVLSEQYHRRRARKAQNGVFLVTARDMRRCLLRFDNSCAYCGDPFDSAKRPTWDHVVAIARGGQHSIGNLVPACSACNTSKWASFVTEWRKRQVARLT